MEPAGFDEELYTASVLRAENYSPVLRIAYTSYLTPAPRLRLPHVADLLLRRETPVLGGYNREELPRLPRLGTCGGRHAHPDLGDSPRRPGHEQAAPGHPVRLRLDRSSMDPMFSIPILSILDRGVIYVIAHIRGGGERWAAPGTRTARSSKKNTFTDFVDVTSYIAAKPWADEARIGCYGGSAGGLLMGAVLNLAPKNYAACPGSRTVRGCADHHPRPRAAAVGNGVGRVGQPD